MSLHSGPLKHISRAWNYTLEKSHGTLTHSHIFLWLCFVEALPGHGMTKPHWKTKDYKHWHLNTSFLHFFPTVAPKMHEPEPLFTNSTVPVSWKTRLCSISVSVCPTITSFSLVMTLQPAAGSTHWNFFTAALFSCQTSGWLNSSSVLAETWNDLKGDLFYLSPFFFALLYILSAFNLSAFPKLSQVAPCQMWKMSNVLSSQSVAVVRTIFLG